MLVFLNLQLAVAMICHQAHSTAKTPNKAFELDSPFDLVTGSRSDALPNSSHCND